MSLYAPKEPLLVVDHCGDFRRAVPIRSWDQLNRHLAALIERGSGTAYYFPEGEAGEHLILGVEQGYGLAFHDPQSDKEPYLSATTRDGPDEEIEFDFGGTPTPIEARHCISVETMIRVAGHYYDHGILLKEIHWSPSGGRGDLLANG